MDMLLLLLMFYPILFVLLSKIIIFIIGRVITLDKFHMYERMEDILLKMKIRFLIGCQLKIIMKQNH